MENKHEYSFDYLRIIACSFVICIHVTSYRSNMFQSLFLSAYLKYIIDCGVPLFFLTSGYVLMKRYFAEKIIFGKFIKKRAKRVILPYFSVSILTIIFRIIIERYRIIPLTDVVYTPFSITKVVFDLLFAGVAQHYYFLISIFIIYCFFPILKEPLKHKYYGILIFVSYLLIYPLIMNWYENLNLPLPKPDIFKNALWGLKYFLAGVFLYKYNKYIKVYLNKFGLLVFSLLFILSIILKKYQIPYGELIIIVSCIFLVYYLGKFKSTKIIQISSLTFGIYLFHQPYFVKFFDVLLTKIGLYGWLFFVTSFALTCFSTLFFIVLLKKNSICRMIFIGEDIRKKKPS